MDKRVRKSARTGSGAREKVTNDPAEAEDVVSRICDTLVTAINVGALKPGAKIRDEAVAAHFGVSRTVVRGALDILQRDHLIERKRNRGAFVAEPSATEAEQLFEARYGLEREILALVVQRATDDGLDRLDSLNEEEAHYPEISGSNSAGQAIAPQFHIELAKLGGNDVLTETLSKLLSRISLVNSVYKLPPKDNCGDHRSILAALRKRDLKLSQKLMTSHLAELEDRVRLTPGREDADSFVAMLEKFSAR